MLPTKADRVRKADALGDGTYLPRSARIDNFFGVKKRRRGRVITSAPHASSGPTPSTSTSTSFPASSYLVQDTVALSSKLSDLVLFSTGDINGEPSSPPRSSLPGPLSPPSPSSSTTLVSNSGPSPPPAYLPAPTHVPVPLASVNASAAQTSLALVSLNLDTDVIFQGYPSMTSIFLRLNDAMSTVVRGCVYHEVMVGSQAPDHCELWRCTAGLLHKNSEFKKRFTVNLHAGYGACCYDCWTPQDQAFKHGFSRCGGKGRAQWESWWRGVPYLVFRTRYLRARVFLALGLREDAFSSIDLFASWLTLAAHSMTNPNRDIRVTNLLTLVFVYFELRAEGKLRCYEGGWWVI